METQSNYYLKRSSNTILLCVVYNIIGFVSNINVNLNLTGIISMSLSVILIITLSLLIRRGFPWVKHILKLLLFFNIMGVLVASYSVLFAGYIRIESILTLANAVTSYLALRYFLIALKSSTTIIDGGVSVLSKVKSIMPYLIVSLIIGILLLIANVSRIPAGDELGGLAEFYISVFYAVVIYALTIFLSTLATSIKSDYQFLIQIAIHLACIILVYFSSYSVCVH